MKNKWVIFDLDGTLANIEDRRRLCTKDNGKMDWDKFFDPKNIKLDKPKQDVIDTLHVFEKAGYSIAIFSGRSASTENATKDWLKKYDINYNILKMRPTGNRWKWIPDDTLKLKWFKDTFANVTSAEVVAVFDDRDKVVKMWRENNIKCLQVASGNF